MAQSQGLCRKPAYSIFPATSFLDDSTKTTDLKEWGKFIAVLYDDILNDKFPKTSTAFEIPLSQVQKYKLQKKGISKNFLTDL